MNETNKAWLELLDHIELNGKETSPRGILVKEVISASYDVPMPAFISLSKREANYSFMFAEAAWIISGSNRLAEIEPYMKNYRNFSDDGILLNGAYGPKVVDQLRYVVNTLVLDKDSRQAVINIWRERPGPSKDIPCTLSMQFLIRNDKLHVVTTMRSQDIVLGFTYDVFTFSMVAKAVQLLLRESGLEVNLGNLYVNVGSLHLYHDFYERVGDYKTSSVYDGEIINDASNFTAETYEKLIEDLKRLANKYRKNK